jgi:FkbM family methyltransferase
MHVRPGVAIEDAIYVYGCYEPSTTELIRGLLGAGMVFADVGANIGYFSLVAASKVGAGGVVHAFEPVDALRERLAGHAQRNGMRQVAIHAEAVTDSCGEVALYQSAWDDNSGLASLVPGAARQGTPTWVPGITLDEVFGAGVSPPHLVKVDVEGAEESVFRGAAGLLSRDAAPVLVFESRNLADASSWLGRFGYETRALGYHPVRGLFFVSGERGGDEPFRDWEAPVFVGAKRGGALGWFDDWQGLGRWGR